jgi:hypothetical protein
MEIMPSQSADEAKTETAVASPAVIVNWLLYLIPFCASKLMAVACWLSMTKLSPVEISPLVKFISTEDPPLMLN